MSDNPGISKNALKGTVITGQHEPPKIYPPPQTAYPPPGTGLAYSAPPATVQPPAYSAAPPPGYPVNGAIPYTQQVPVETKQRGDGFWKGW
ncbi:hypothetical protein MA16_Dca001397 [Dendrobium catenatum]|uniref:Uncharacterized protein n=1 Tax=Dendrobium catenatum TaxID=906689 RepID=A0A2I0WMA9_9ASPA|nr:hypothetical protein MA16_Dca001397 [Dendrobium catenatum]